MSLEINNFRLGLFFFIGSFLLFLLLILLIDNIIENDTTKYVSYFEVSVQGLNYGSKVLYNGVPIGKVSNISIAPDGRLVQVTMDIESSFRVDSTITATLQHVSISGLRIINLQSDSANIGIIGILPELTFDPPYPTIPVTAGTTDGIFAVRERLTQIERDIDFSRISDQTDLLLQNLDKIFGEVPMDSFLTSVLSTSSLLNTRIRTWNRYGDSLFLRSETIIRETQEFTSATIRTQHEGIDFIQELISLLIFATDKWDNLQIIKAIFFNQGIKVFQQEMI